MQKKKRKRRIRLGPIILFFLLLALVFFFIRSIVAIGYRPLKVTNPKMTNYKKVIKGQGYILLNQDHFYAKNSGLLVYGAKEGEKVPVGQEIVTVNFQEDYSKQKDQLMKIQAAIDYKNNKRKPTDQDYQQTPELVSIIEKMQVAIQEKDYPGLVGEINHLDMVTPHNVNISDLSNYLNLSLEDLEGKKDQLNEDLSKTRSRYVSTFPGVISYVFPSGRSLSVQKENMDKFTLSYLDNLKFTKRQQSGVHIKKGQPVFRIIDNLCWYMALSIHQDDQLKQVKLGDEVSLSINKGPALKASVQQINLDKEDEGVVILAMKEGFEDYYTLAKGQGEMILKQKDAYSLPSKTLVDQDGQMGLYIQDIHNLVRFVPVNVLGQNANWVYVEKGDMKNKIKIKGKDVQTVTYEDDVVLDPSSVDRKQMLD